MPEERFDKACRWLEERPGDLKTVCEEQIESYVEISEEGFDSGWEREHKEVKILNEQNPEEWKQYLKECKLYWKDSTKRKPHEWLQRFEHLRDNLDTVLQRIDPQNERNRKMDKHVLDHHRMLACIGIGSHGDLEMDQAMDNYVNHMDKLLYDIQKSLRDMGTNRQLRSRVNNLTDEFISTKADFKIYLQNIGLLSSKIEPMPLNAETGEQSPLLPGLINAERLKEGKEPIPLKSWIEESGDDSTSESKENDVYPENKSSQGISEIADRNVTNKEIEELQVAELDAKRKTRGNSKHESSQLDSVYGESSTSDARTKNSFMQKISKIYKHMPNFGWHTMEQYSKQDRVISDITSVQHNKRSHRLVEKIRNLGVCFNRSEAPDVSYRSESKQDELASNPPEGQRIDLSDKRDNREFARTTTIKIGERSDGRADISTLSKTEQHKLKGKIVINADKYTPIKEENINKVGTKKLKVNDLKRAGLFPPRHKVKIENATILISQIFKVGDRVAVIGYVKEDDSDKYIARSYYLSQSQGIWRYLPKYCHRIIPGYKIPRYLKGYQEESVTIPISLQLALIEIHKNQKEGPVQVPGNPQFYFEGTARAVSGNDIDKKHYIDEITLISRTTFKKDVEEEPKRFSFEDANPYEGHRMHPKVVPDQIEFKDPQKKPNFSHLDPIGSIQQDTGLYGQITIDIYESTDKNLQYMFCRTQDNKKAWIGGIEDVTKPIKSVGLREGWVDAGDLTTPAYEYQEQIGKKEYANYEDQKVYDPRTGEYNYVDMFENYISKIPVIQEYLECCEKRGIVIQQVDEENKRDINIQQVDEENKRDINIQQVAPSPQVDKGNKHKTRKRILSMLNTRKLISQVWPMQNGQS